MPGTARKVVISERQQELLQTLTRSSTCSQGVARRSAIVLLAFEGDSNQEIANKVGLGRHQVGLWRLRWQRAWQRLTTIECSESPSVFRAAVLNLLSDEPRAGVTPTFTPEQITDILAVACEPPEESGRPVTHWTPTELAAEAVKRGIVPSISARHVGRFLKGGRPEAASNAVLAELARQTSRPAVRRTSPSGL
jgi:putative transposase